MVDLLVSYDFKFVDSFIDEGMVCLQWIGDERANMCIIYQYPVSKRSNFIESIIFNTKTLEDFEKACICLGLKKVE